MALSFSWGNGDHVLFLGDTVLDDPMGYPRLIAAMVTAQYPERAISFEVRALGGDRLPEVLGRLGDDLLGWHPRPTRIVVALGSNDIWDGAAGTPIGRFRALYAALLARLRDLQAHLLCLTTTLYGEELENPTNQAMAVYNEAIREIAFAHGADVVDVNQAMREALRQARAATPTFRYTVDNLHLNVYGHFLVALAVLQALNFSLRREPPEELGRQAA